jgi:hypothetical protein
MIVVTNCSGLSIDFDNLTIYRVDKFKRDPKKVTPAESEEWSDATKKLIAGILNGQAICVGAGGEYGMRGKNYYMKFQKN